MRNDVGGFRDWLGKVIVCTEQNYDQAELANLVRTEPTFLYKDKYMDLL
jgi:hypothetical protein